MKMCKGDHRDDDYFTYKCLLYRQLWRHKAALQKMTLTLKTTFDFYHVLLSSTSIPIMCHCIKKNKVQRSRRMLVACIFFFVIFNA